MECSGAIEGVHEDHCLHDLRKKDARTRGQLAAGGFGRICCWCGDLFHSQEQTDEHGEYEPGLATSVRLKREAAGRTEARVKLRENRAHAKDYGQGFLSAEEVEGLERVIAWPKRKLKHICPECGKPKSKPVVCRECKR